MQTPSLWEESLVARFPNRPASFARLIVFDRRGTGMSGRVPASVLPTLAQRMDDVRAVIDAVGSRYSLMLLMASTAHRASGSQSSTS